MTRIQSHGMPAMKNMTPQVPMIRMVWPRSGCATSSASTTPSRIMANRLPGMSGCRLCSANSQAQMMTKAGFKNSDGWIETPKKDSQRCAPFTSTPTKSTATIITSIKPSRKSEKRRI